MYFTNHKIKTIKLVVLIMLFLSSPLYANERVSGTKVSISPLTGFVKSSQFPGYMMESTGASVMITEIPIPIKELHGGFTKSGLSYKGMSLIKSKNIQIASGAAELIHVSQVAHGIDYLKWMLLFGNDNESVLIVATFPKPFEKELSEKLKNSLLKAQWNTDAKIDFWDGMSFKVDEAGDLKIANKMGNNLFLTRGGVFPQKNKGDPIVIVGASITSSSWQLPRDKKVFSNKRLAQTEIFTNYKVISGETMVIDGLNAYLIKAEGKDKDTGEMLYVIQCVIFTSNGYYIFQSFINSIDKGKYYPVFISILNSFRRI